MSNSTNSTSSLATPSQIDWVTDVMPPPFQPQPHGPRHGKRALLAAHSGFGFGANTIKEKSQQISRESLEKRYSRIHSLLSKPVNTEPPVQVVTQPRFPITPALPVIPTPPVAADIALAQEPIVTPAPPAEFSAATATTPLAPITTFPTLKNGSAIEFNAPAKMGANHSTKKSTATATNSEQKTNSSISVGRAFLAWVLDSIVAASIFVIATGASYVSPTLEMGAPIVRALDKLTAAVGAGNPFLVVMAFKTIVVAMILIFVSQLIMLIATGATAGRFAMGMRLEGKDTLTILTSSLLAAASEAATLGGILSLPFIVSLPSRVPLAPWIRFEIQDEDL